MFQVAIIFVLAVAVFVVMRLALKGSKLSLRAFFIWYLLALVGAALLFLGLTGRLHWLFVLVGSLLPFAGGIIRWGLRLWQSAAIFRGLRGLFQQLNPGAGYRSRGAGQQNSHQNTGQTSEVNTTMLRMVLDHDTGQMHGEVLGGQFAGRQLADLSLSELKVLHNSVADDESSRQLLETYLDREHPEWQSEPANKPSGDMTIEDALEILGLTSGATTEEIKKAHKRIIQKLHPDRGGSTFLASQVNEAKDLLLKQNAK